MLSKTQALSELFIFAMKCNPPNVEFKVFLSSGVCITCLANSHIMAYTEVSMRLLRKEIPDTIAGKQSLVRSKVVCTSRQYLGENVNVQWDDSDDTMLKLSYNIAVKQGYQPALKPDLTN